MNKELLQQALDALKGADEIDVDMRDAIMLIEAAIAQPAAGYQCEPQPVKVFAADEGGRSRLEIIADLVATRKEIWDLRAALAQPVQPANDKLLQIIAATYQIAGVYDAPEHVLDVLANPELATQEQIDALLPFAQPVQSAVPQEPVLQDIEQYRLQMAGICYAALGYWEEDDGIHPDYDTLAFRDVAKLYAKYDALYNSQPVSHATIAGALFDFMGWLTSRKERIVLSSADEASPAVDAIRDFAKMRDLSLDDAKVQDWNTTPPQRPWVGLTDKDRQTAFESLPNMLDGFLKNWGWLHFSNAIEAKLKEKNND